MRCFIDKEFGSINKPKPANSGLKCYLKETLTNLKLEIYKPFSSTYKKAMSVREERESERAKVSVNIRLDQCICMSSCNIHYCNSKPLWYHQQLN